MLYGEERSYPTAYNPFSRTSIFKIQTFQLRTYLAARTLNSSPSQKRGIRRVLSPTSRRGLSLASSYWEPEPQPNRFRDWARQGPCEGFRARPMYKHVRILQAGPCIGFFFFFFFEIAGLHSWLLNYVRVWSFMWSSLRHIIWIWPRAPCHLCSYRFSSFSPCSCKPNGGQCLLLCRLRVITFLSAWLSEISKSCTTGFAKSYCKEEEVIANLCFFKISVIPNSPSSSSMSSPNGIA